MRPKGTAEELERRRRRAVSLLEEGHSLSAVGRMVGAAPSAVHAWRERVRRGGARALAAKPASGRPLKLTKKQRCELHAKFAGHCAYCGVLLGDRWHADHMEAVWREPERVDGKYSGAIRTRHEGSHLP